jgi:hypothetical protein
MASPPWATAIIRTIARPSPAPPPSRRRDGSARWNGTNAEGRKPPGNPGPSSTTLIRIWPGSWLAPSTTRPPAGVWVRALSRRLSIAWRSRLGSHVTRNGRGYSPRSDTSALAAGGPNASSERSRTSARSCCSSRTSATPLSLRANSSKARSHHDCPGPVGSVDRYDEYAGLLQLRCVDLDRSPAGGTTEGSPRQPGRQRQRRTGRRRWTMGRRSCPTRVRGCVCGTSSRPDGARTVRAVRTLCPTAGSRSRPRRTS